MYLLLWMKCQITIFCVLSNNIGIGKFLILNSCRTLTCLNPCYSVTLKCHAVNEYGIRYIYLAPALLFIFKSKLYAALILSSLCWIFFPLYQLTQMQSRYELYTGHATFQKWTKQGLWSTYFLTFFKWNWMLIAHRARLAGVSCLLPSRRKGWGSPVVSC